MVGETTTTFQALLSLVKRIVSYSNNQNLKLNEIILHLKYITDLVFA